MLSTTSPRSRPRRSVTAVLTAALVLALAPVGLVAAAGSASAATTTVSLSATSTTWSDRPVVLTGRWTVGGAGHRGAVAVDRLDGHTWLRLTGATTSSSGTASFTVAPTTSTTYRLRTSDGHVSASRTVTVLPADVVALSATSKVLAGAPATVSVNATHHGSGVGGTVYIERRSGSSWVRVTSLALRSGRASTTVRPTVPTTLRARTAWATSPSRAVAIAVPSSFTATGAGNGHGVGMSQYGAYAMALQGYSATGILTHFYQGATVKPVTTPERIKVQVWGPEPYGYTPGLYSDTATTTTIAFTSSWTVSSTGAGAGAGAVLSGTSTDTLRVAVTGGKLVLSRLDGNLVEQTVSAPTATASFTTTWTGVASVAGARGTYHDGTLVLTAIGGQPNVVVDLLLDTEYLYGIDEMPSSWGVAGSGKGVQALEAQAVVARSYVLAASKTALKKACNCNVVDDVRDQSYTGWTKESEKVGTVDYGALWRKAVDATVTSPTSGTAVTTGGQIAQTPYFAASGGLTANNHDVWQGASASPQLPYLVSVTDPGATSAGAAATGNPYTSWTDSFSQATARKTFPTLSDVATVRVTERYSSGQVRTMSATSTTGKVATVSASADWWRSTLGLAGSWVTGIAPHA